jgi:hypothetical protein
MLWASTATILSNPTVVNKSPFDVASELLLLADKNMITGLVGKKQRTIDAVSQVTLQVWELDWRA